MSTGFFCKILNLVPFGAVSSVLPDANFSGSSNNKLISGGLPEASLSMQIAIPWPEKTATFGSSAG